MDQLVLPSHRPILADGVLHPKGEWVSKSDVLTYRRCPFVFWLLDTGQVEFEDTLGPSGRALVAAGQAQREAELGAASTEHAAPEASRGYAADILLDPPLLYNPERKLLGRPDGVWLEAGAFVPIVAGELDRDVSRTDELGLAFYWLLLEPNRQRGGLEPWGYVRVDTELWRVPLTSARFAELERLIAGVRAARRDGVKPRLHHCIYCRETPEGRRRIESAVRGTKDLTMIWGIGRAMAERLEALGLRSFKGLLRRDPERLARTTAGVRPEGVTAWQAHARSYLKRRPVMFGTERLPVGDMVVLDLEYYPAAHRIWLIGYCEVIRGRRRYVQRLVESPAREGAHLRTLCRRLRTSSLPLLTWGGTTADIPQLRTAVARRRLPRGDLEATLACHIDAYAFVRDNVRLPILRAGLDDVAAYFRIRRHSQIRSGLEALSYYARYRRARGREKRRLARALIYYNREDLRLLVETVERLRALR